MSSHSSISPADGSPSETSWSFARLWAALRRAQPEVGHASDQHQVRMRVCVSQCVRLYVYNPNVSQGATRCVHHSERETTKSPAASLRSPPAWNEGLKQMIQSTTVTALIQPTKKSERRPACPLRFAILGLPWFKNCAETGAIILGSCMQAARTQEP